MHEELSNIKLKLKALGFSQFQIESIIEESLAGNKWEEISDSEKQELLHALDNRIIFARKIFQFISCDTCCKKSI